MIKNIIFDLGGVLVSLDKNRCLQRFSQDLGFDNFGDYLNPYAQKGFFAEFENGDMDSVVFREIVKGHCKKTAIEDLEIDMALNSFLTNVEPYKVELLLQLKEKYNLMLLSNVNPIAWKRCCELFLEAKGIDMEDMFERLYLSFEMKSSKPGTKIFEMLLEDSGAVPSETLFIDDSPANVETGKSLGLNTLLYNVSDNLAEKVKAVLEELGEQW